MTEEEKWLERVLSWHASGVSAAEYCEGAGLSAGSLRSWSSRLGREGKVHRAPMGRRPKQAAAMPSVRFARVVPTAARAEPRSSPAGVPQSRCLATALVVAIGETRIEVSVGFDPSLLRAVVCALGGGAR